MASKAMTEENNARTCSICIESFKHPKLLPCFHTFCLGCLEQYTSKQAVDGKFPCPVCRFEVSIPQSGVKGFQTNFYIEAQSIQDEHAGGSCEVCSQTALNRCQECEQLLCEHCTNVHSSLKLTRSHTLIRLEETSREKPILFKPEFCPKHKGELFRFHCQKCERAICRDCKLTSHESHPTVDLEDVIDEGREKLSKVKVEFEELVAAFDRKLQKNSANKGNFVKSVLDIEKDINETADAMVSLINDARQTKLKELSDLKKSELDHHDTMDTYFNQEKKFLEGHIGHVTTLLTEGCGADVLNTLPDMKKRLGEFKTESNRADVKQKMSVTLRVNTVTSVSNKVSVRLINRKFMSASVKSITPTFSFLATAQRGAVDFLCPVSNDQVWVGMRMPFGKCSLTLFDYKGVAVKGFHMSKERYEGTRLKGIVEMLNGLDGENASEEIQALKGDINLKCKPYTDTKGGSSCTVDVAKKVVLVNDVNNGKELELSALDMACAEDFSPRDVCWGEDSHIFIADGGSNSVIVFKTMSAQLMSIKVTCAHFEPCAVAKTKTHLLIGDASGCVYGFTGK